MNVECERITLDVPKGAGDLMRKGAEMTGRSERHLWISIILLGMRASTQFPGVVESQIEEWIKAESGGESK